MDKPKVPTIPRAFVTLGGQELQGTKCQLTAELPEPERGITREWERFAGREADGS